MPRGTLILGKQTALDSQITELLKKNLIAFLQREQVIDAQQRTAFLRMRRQSKQRQDEQKNADA